MQTNIKIKNGYVYWLDDGGDWNQGAHADVINVIDPLGNEYPYTVEEVLAVGGTVEADEDGDMVWVRNGQTIHEGNWQIATLEDAIDEGEYFFERMEDEPGYHESRFPFQW